MSGRLGIVFSRVVALIFGILWGFFVAFNVVFSDVFGLTGMLGALLYVIVGYLILGFFFGAIGSHTGTRWTPWLAGPGMAFTAFALFDNFSRMIYVTGVIVATLGATYLGCRAGSWIRGRISKERKTA